MNMSDSQSYPQSSSQQSNESILSQQQEQIQQQLKEMPYQYLIKYHQQQNQSKKNEGNPKIKKIKINKPLPKTKMDEEVDKYASKQVKIMKAPPRQHYKTIFQSIKQKTIDPRFEDYAGSYNADLASKSYSFIPKLQEKQAKQIKKRLKSKKIKEQDRQTLLKNYNRVTSDLKANEIRGIEKDVRLDYKKNKKFNPKKRQFKEEVERVKLSRMSEVDQRKRIQKKNKKIQKNRIIQRKRMMK